jgi:small nuclear ribonucleoprotein (snRNP)-like protein
VDVKKMTEDIQMPNGDFLKNYPDVTRVEVITNDGREFVRYGCSNVQVSLQDDGRTLKVSLYSMFQTGT